jgi:two-component system, LytTR family, sensor kinase
MSKKRIIYIHIFIWLFALFANLPYSNAGKGILPQQIVSYVIGYLYLMFVFYMFYSVLVPYFLDKKKMAEFFGFSFIVVLIMPFIGYTILFVARGFFEGSFNNFYRGYSVRMHMSGYFPVLTAAVFGSFFRVILYWFITLNQKAETDKQRISIELELLKNKLNPHFLFNTLNNIDALIHNSPDEASASLIRLSDMMRYLTYETDADKVELKKEIEYIRNFIELYRIRIRKPEDIRLEVNVEENLMIAPALVVPLIENAFKYVSYRIQKPSLSISISSEKGVVTFDISNYFDIKNRKPDSDHSGFGITNLEKRLELIYPGRYQLKIDPQDSLFQVKLIIDTNAH